MDQYNSFCIGLLFALIAAGILYGVVLLAVALGSWISAKRKKPKKSHIVPMRAGITHYNGSTEACDAFEGPCVCGAWHHREDWPVEICEAQDR